MKEVFDSDVTRESCAFRDRQMGVPTFTEVPTRSAGLEDEGWFFLWDMIDTLLDLLPEGLLELLLG